MSPDWWAMRGTPKRDVASKASAMLKLEESGEDPAENGSAPAESACILATVCHGLAQSARSATLRRRSAQKRPPQKAALPHRRPARRQRRAPLCRHPITEIQNPSSRN